MFLFNLCFVTLCKYMKLYYNNQVKQSKNDYNMNIFLFVAING